MGDASPTSVCIILFLRGQIPTGSMKPLVVLQFWGPGVHNGSHGARTKVSVGLRSFRGLWVNQPFPFPRLPAPWLLPVIGPHSPPGVAPHPSSTSPATPAASSAPQTLVMTLAAWRIQDVLPVSVSAD